MLTAKQQQWIPAIAKLIQLTQNRKLEWITEAIQPGVVGWTVQVGQYKLRIYQHLTKVVLHVLCKESSVLLVSLVEGLDDLMDAVQSQTTNVDIESFFDELEKL
tara:strand:- start:209 stop:520 length:312 start_codon:yes stop_codon:yes gene_type:complete